MKVLKNIIKIIVLVLFLFVLIQNSDQRVTLEIFTYEFSDINLALILLITLGLGAVLGALMLSFALIQHRSEIRSLQKKNKQLTKELENLRNISIDEIPDDSIQDGSESKS